MPVPPGPSPSTWVGGEHFYNKTIIIISALLSLPSFQAVLRTFRESKAQLGEILSSCEFIDAGSMECVTTNLSLSCPLADNQFYMLIGGAASLSHSALTTHFLNI